jgi:hypothetical protein
MLRDFSRARPTQAAEHEKHQAVGISRQPECKTGSLYLVLSYVLIEGGYTKSVRATQLSRLDLYSTSLTVWAK